MRLHSLAVVCAVVFMLCARPAGAADCAGQTQADLTACAGVALQAADAKLNATYKTILQRLASNADTRARLVVAERAWVAFRDAQCSFAAAGVQGGSIAPMIEAQCRADLTARRQAELAVFLACPEGDMSCPVPRG